MTQTCGDGLPQSASRASRDGASAPAPDVVRASPRERAHTPDVDTAAIRARCDALRDNDGIGYEPFEFHTYDCDRFETYDYGTRSGKCDCEAEDMLTRLLATLDAQQAEIERLLHAPRRNDEPSRLTAGEARELTAALEHAESENGRLKRSNEAVSRAVQDYLIRWRQARADLADAKAKALREASDRCEHECREQGHSRVGSRVPDACDYCGYFAYKARRYARATAATSGGDGGLCQASTRGYYGDDSLCAKPEGHDGDCHATWRHARPFEPHPAQPDISRQYVQPGTDGIEAPCLTCGEAVISAAAATSSGDEWASIRWHHWECDGDPCRCIDPTRDPALAGTPDGTKEERCPVAFTWAGKTYRCELGSAHHDLHQDGVVVWAESNHDPVPGCCDAHEPAAGGTEEGGS